ncbi:DUF3422 family protein [Rubrivivax rivuli]|uniref:DUF3422 domain-containing protein n=1 Tax=Rubrivivax rivuli TaxID=1862385 RepID=A0A437RKS4_9BURK|nr:DUF3422 domain-containing protein [Rubrivivax rivuli]RVU47235.1 DUF3422 domain-containing protein [Rubrivivax rivuli]
MSMFPPDHALRTTLADEIHARPPEAVEAPARASYVAVLVEADQRTREFGHLCSLCDSLGVEPPLPGASHFRAEFNTERGHCRLKWERHGEFSGYTVIAADVNERPFQAVAASLLPEGWLAALPGATIAAAHATLLVAPEETRLAGLLEQAFAGQTVAGAVVADGAARVYTDFRLHEGCTRFVLVDNHLTERQAGRTLQRLFEIEAYRTLALLALPIARRQGPRIVQIEAALAQLTDGIARGEGDDEVLLHELTRLAAEVESGLAASQFRFGACRAYEDLVMRRIAELREQRLSGVPPIEEFMARRFRPAVATCATVSQRLHDLSERVAQASALLSTRVDITRERQNQALLASMDRRAKLQLRLQQTVEGLSVAAICYYVAGLVGYGAKGLKAGGLPVNADLLTGLSIPLVAVAVVLAVRRARRRVAADEAAH